MTVSIGTIHILVDDPDAALGFYRDGLGLAVVNEVARGGFRWITLSTQSQPEIQIVLSQPQAGRSPEEAAALAELLAKGEFRPVHFATEDLDGTLAKAAAVPGVTVLQEPTSQPWGARDAVVRDPAGNVLRIEQS